MKKLLLGLGILPLTILPIASMTSCQTKEVIIKKVYYKVIRKFGLNMGHYLYIPENQVINYRYIANGNAEPEKMHITYYDYSKAPEGSVVLVSSQVLERIEI